LVTKGKAPVRDEVLIGNGAIARGLVEAGCDVITGYPGTPSSEIIPFAVRFKKEEDLPTYIEWSSNEKVAFDNAYAAAVTGKRSAVVMKQVGLNVASDSLMSAAYTGVVGGMVVISCDDPGPHSSQTEQDTRLFAHFAKVPVFDPSSPREAVRMMARAFEVSEKHRIPVLFRASIRVCHAKQNIRFEVVDRTERKAAFAKDPARWAATPKFRFLLHGELNEKLSAMSAEFAAMRPFNGHNLTECGAGKTDTPFPLGVIAGGVPWAAATDILQNEGLSGRIPVLKLGVPHPLPTTLVDEFLAACEKVLVIEETDPVIELLSRERSKILGRYSGHVPSAGELTPEKVRGILSRAVSEAGLDAMDPGEGDAELGGILEEMGLPVIRPSLCPGCGHRAAFFAIRKAFKKAIFTSDIGCYTLGLNLGAVDTVLDMGAAITMASGFHQAYHQDGVEKPVVATIGDSTHDRHAAHPWDRIACRRKRGSKDSLGKGGEGVRRGLGARRGSLQLRRILRPLRGGRRIHVPEGWWHRRAHIEAPLPREHQVHAKDLRHEGRNHRRVQRVQDLCEAVRVPGYHIRF
jgi:indolepyruvate ferredoxin oxidoreductase alpha subunit